MQDRCRAWVLIIPGLAEPFASSVNVRVSIPHVINLCKPARGILSDARQAAQSEARLPIDKSQIIKQNRAVISLVIACNMPLLFSQAGAGLLSGYQINVMGVRSSHVQGWAGISVPATAPAQMLSWRVSRSELWALHQELQMHRKQHLILSSHIQ